MDGWTFWTNGLAEKFQFQFISQLSSNILSNIFLANSNVEYAII